MFSSWSVGIGTTKEVKPLWHELSRTARRPGFPALRWSAYQAQRFNPDGILSALSGQTNQAKTQSLD